MARTRTAAAPVIDLTMSDGELAEQAAAGSSSAFDALYRRHAQVAWRVAQAITGNREDASDAVSEAFTRVLQALPAGRLQDSGQFRSYLLAATRNAAIDGLRRSGRSRPTDSIETLERPNVVSGPAEVMINAADTSLVAAAFLGLPERWRSVLWLTEVEGIPAKDAAALLGLSPNGVAQLAVRARAGLRERFLQAHLGDVAVAEGCRHTVERLGAYVAGGLAPRDIAKVDQHLAACEDCRARHDELADLGSTLRRAALPLPLGLGALTLKHFHAVLAASSSVRPKAGTLPSWALKAQRPLAVAATVLVAGGLVGLGVVGDKVAPGPHHRSTTAGGPVPAPVILPAAAPAASTTATPAALATTGQSFDALPATQAGVPAAAPDATAPAGTTSAAPSPAPTGDTSSTPPPGTTTAAQPTAQVVTYVNAPVSAAVAAGTPDGGCTGITVDGQDGGCTPPPDSSSGTITVSTSGSTLPAQQLTLP